MTASGQSEAFPGGEAKFADAFVKVSFEDETDKEPGDPLFGKWASHGSAQHVSPEVSMTKALRELYPKHSIVMTQDFRGSLLSFPGSTVVPLSPNELITNVTFIPLARKGPVPGVLADAVYYGAFRMAWANYDFILYILKWTAGFGIYTENFILHEGDEKPARQLLYLANAWVEQLHNEIYVFNQGFWQKDAGLWQDVQSASWDDVILEEQFKTALQKDIYGFFSSEAMYKKLSLPWKRGIIMHGPPGNGKTISIKAIMKTCDAKGYTPMYVKSFKSYMGEEGSMLAVFNKARQMAPCVLILEDLDALINDQNRSFFLNELDGLQGNDGLLVIGTTNHFDRLDPGLSTRPSRFDRKYLFDDPNLDARLLYAQYWQEKLKDNEEISYPDTLAQKIATTTNQFSFAYLKEAFVSALVVFLTDREDGKSITFEEAITSQIKTLRKQLDKSTDTDMMSSSSSIKASTPSSPPFFRRYHRMNEDVPLTSQPGSTGAAAGHTLPASAPLPPVNRTFHSMSMSEENLSALDSLVGRLGLTTKQTATPQPLPDVQERTFTTAPSSGERDTVMSVLHNFVQRIGGNGALQGGEIGSGGINDGTGVFPANASVQGEDGAYSTRRWI